MSIIQNGQISLYCHFNKIIKGSFIAKLRIAKLAVLFHQHFVQVALIKRNIMLKIPRLELNLKVPSFRSK